jgi:hypothetical protein
MREEDFEYAPPFVASAIHSHPGEINIMRWAPDLKNIAGALTKRYCAVFFLLNNLCVTSILPHHMFEREIKYDSKTWR